MWLSRLLTQLAGFISAYVKNLHGAGFDFLRSFSMTKPQISRFYWVNSILCAIALYYLFVQAQGLRQSDPLNQACAQKQSLGVIAIFVLAELASFILLIGAQWEGWLNNWLASPSHKKPLASREETARRIHRILWTWFPPALAASAYLSAGRLDGVVVWCSNLPLDKYDPWTHSLLLLWALFWPGLLISFVVVVVANWLIYRWALDSRAAVTVSVAFLSYVLAAAIVGPPDLMGIVKLLRQLPGQMDWLFKILIGQ